jgi:hypothetical protein
VTRHTCVDQEILAEAFLCFDQYLLRCGSVGPRPPLSRHTVKLRRHEAASTLSDSA